MAFSGTLATEAEVDLAIGENPNAAQTLDTNLTIWLGWAQADMEIEFGKNIGLVANYDNITAALKPWLANKAANRAAWYAFQQDQNNWTLSTTQSKLNVADAIWREFVSDVKAKGPDIVKLLNLSPT